MENLPQFSKNDKPTDYMTPPSLPSNLKATQNSNASNRPHVIPLSTNQDHKKYSQASRPEKIAIRHHDSSSLSSGQGHVHTEILVHHGGESGQTRPQSSSSSSRQPVIPAHNYQTIQFPRKDYTKLHVPVDQTPPRRTEVPVPTENSYYEQSSSSANWNKNEKKPLRPSQVRWPRPTSRPRPPTKITGRPYGRPPTRLERPSGSVRPPQFSQRLPTTTYYQSELHKFNNQQAPTSVPSFSDSSQQMYTPQQDKPHNYFQENYAGINLQVTTNHTVHDYKGDSFADQINSGLSYQNSGVGQVESDSKIMEKPVDSEVDASENVRISTGPQDKIEDDIIVADDSDRNKFETTITFDQDRVGENGDGEIIMGSEKKQDQYLSQSPYSGYDTISNDHHSVFVTDTGPQQNISTQPQSVNLQRPSYNHPSVELNGHSRPFSKPHFDVSDNSKVDIITESPNHKDDEIVHGHMKPGFGQVLHVQNDENGQLPSRKNESRVHVYRPRPKPDFSQRHPQIITKPKLKTPRPVVVSSGKVRKPNNAYRKPQVQQFSLAIDSTGEENDSNSQTERPPSSETKMSNYDKKPTQESLDTAFQTNFANDDSKVEESNDRKETAGSYQDIRKITISKSKPLAQDMVPPPVTPVFNQEISKNDEGLKPPPPPTVLGLTPPPVDITTTTRPVENKPKKNTEVSGLKPPPLYIPLQESSTPSQPSVDMIPPSPRPSIVRPFLADVLSQVSRSNNTERK